MDLTPKNQVVTQRYEAVEGNFKYSVLSITTDNVVSQVKCDIDETVTEQSPIPDSEETTASTKLVRLGSITLSNGYKDVHILASAEAAVHVAAFEEFVASISA